MRPASPDIEHYAEALVALGRATHTLDRLEKDVHTAGRLLLDDPAVLRFLKDPFVELSGKINAMDELLSVHVSPELLHVLRLLLERGEIDRLGRIAETFSSAVAGQDKETAGLLVSACPLDEGTVQDIEEEVGRFVGNDVRLRAEIDPHVLGGIRVRVGDYVFDDTVAHHLERTLSALSR